MLRHFLVLDQTSDFFRFPVVVRNLNQNFFCPVRACWRVFIGAKQLLAHLYRPDEVSQGPALHHTQQHNVKQIKSVQRVEPGERLGQKIETTLLQQIVSDVQQSVYQHGRWTGADATGRRLHLFW